MKFKTQNYGTHTPVCKHGKYSPPPPPPPQKDSYQALRDNKFWYDKECRNEKKEMNKLGRANKSALLLITNDQEISTAKMHYVSRRRIYKKLRRRKEREYWNRKKDELRNFKQLQP